MPVISELYKSPNDLPDAIALFPLSQALLLPHTNLPLNIFEPRYLAMIDAAMSGSRLIGMIQPAGGQDEADADTPALEAVGTAGRITTYSELPDGRYLITLTGISRFRVVEELPAVTPFRQATIDTRAFAADLVEQESDEGIDRDAVIKTLNDYVTANDLKVDWDVVAKTADVPLVNSLAMMSPFGPKEKQALLEAQTPADRSQVLIALTEMALAQNADPDTPHLQ